MSSEEETWEPQAQVISFLLTTLITLAKKINSDPRAFAELMNCVFTMYETLL